VHKCTAAARRAVAKFLLVKEREAVMIARVMLVALVLAIGTAHAQVYRWKDRHGKVHYGDEPSTAGTTSTLTNISPQPGVKRTAASDAAAPQAQKPPQAKGEPQKEAGQQARQATEKR
jgi:hypothetical protein